MGVCFLSIYLRGIFGVSSGYLRGVFVMMSGVDAWLLKGKNTDKFVRMKKKLYLCRLNENG